VSGDAEARALAFGILDELRKAKPIDDAWRCLRRDAKDDLLDRTIALASVHLDRACFGEVRDDW